MSRVAGRASALGSGGWLRDFLPRLRSHRKFLAVAFAAMVLDALLTVGRPWPLKVVIDCVIAPEPKPGGVPVIGAWLEGASVGPTAVLYGACAATLFIAVSTGLLTYFFTRVLGDVSQQFIFALRRDLFAHMQRLSLRFHDRHRTGDLTARLTSDVRAIQDIIANGTILFVSNACLLAGMLAVMFWLNWQFAFSSLAVSPLLFWTVYRSTQRIKSAARQARESEGQLAAVAQETLASIRIVQGLAQEEQQSERFEAEGASSQEAHRESHRYQARVAPLVDVLAAIGLVIVMWHGATLVRAGQLTTGDVVIFFAYVTNLYSPMKALAKLAPALSKAGAAAERITEVLRERSEVADRPDARDAVGVRGAIEFRDVSFEYAVGQPVLAHLDLSIPAGQKVALVGATGAGKSTLMSLIPRLYDPGGGAVHIDGKDIRALSLRSLRDQISLVLQDTLIFSGTIRENIAFGRPDATDAEIAAAAEHAYADEFIRRLPDGYDTPVAERGTTLSGGQKQRIAIARAILRDTPILLMDEPTSGLDAASERIVLEALERASKGRTTVVIAHRPATLRFVDRVIVLEGGRVVADGPPPKADLPAPPAT